MNPLVQAHYHSMLKSRLSHGYSFTGFYVNALLFMLRERGPLHWKKQSDTCYRSSPRVSAPKFPLRESKCKTMDRSNLDESFNCGAPDLGHGIFSGFE
ncbi:hypothetical protein NPIL_630721 [Nephila pilipes]|uniref:Uncharacterized protein n=1 Tax=Nephila pilipes TaxID=299642 RepID=A0A8X6TJH5_NEPPI|nr:hypothetical protein NPIL_630721 [Nephila pilipes]